MIGKNCSRRILTIAGYPLTGAALEESSTYTIIRDESGVLRVDFGRPGDNAQIVKDADARLDAMRRTGELSSGALLKINGPASIPVAMVLVHKVSHLFGAIACFDPKLNTYVVAISHSPKYAVGDLIDCLSI